MYFYIFSCFLDSSFYFKTSFYILYFANQLLYHFFMRFFYLRIHCIKTELSIHEFYNIYLYKCIILNLIQHTFNFNNHSLSIHVYIYIFFIYDYLFHHISFYHKNNNNILIYFTDAYIHPVPLH